MIDNFKRNITNFMEVLSQSVKVRLEKMPKFCKKCIENYQSAKCMDAKVGILFSGKLNFKFVNAETSLTVCIEYHFF